jgi:hypothetical protein
LTAGGERACAFFGGRENAVCAPSQHPPNQFCVCALPHRSDIIKGKAQLMSFSKFHLVEDDV